MKFPLAKFWRLLVVLSLAGCATKGGLSAITPSSAQRIYKLPFESVWTATLAVMTEDLKLDLNEVVPQNGLISTKWLTFSTEPGDAQQSNQLFQGTEKAPMLMEYKVIVLVKTGEEGTMVRARRYVREYKNRWYSLPTDLSFERQFLELVSARLGVKNP